MQLIGHFRVPPGPRFQKEGRCSAFDMEIIFHSHANKTHFHKKGSAPSMCSIILKVSVLWNSEALHFSILVLKTNKANCISVLFLTNTAFKAMSTFLSCKEWLLTR